MVVGDYNVVIKPKEKIKGNPINTNDFVDFNSMISTCRFNDGEFSGSKFTWSNNRLGRASILDRLKMALRICQWIDAFITSSVHLNGACSDHSPHIITLGSMSSTGSSFRFINTWIIHKSIVQDTSRQIYGQIFY